MTPVRSTTHEMSRRFASPTDTGDGGSIMEILELPTSAAEKNSSGLVARKLGRTDMHPVTHHSLDDGESVADYATVQLKESFAELLCNWQKAIEVQGVQEPVHQLRVSSRRVRAAIELFEDFLPGRKSRRLLEALDEVRKSAGPVRDGDVILARLEKDEREPGIRQALIQYLRTQRSEAKATMLEHYEQFECGEELEQKALELLATLRPRGRRSKKLDARFNEWVRQQLGTLTGQFFADAKVDTEHLECLHQFRIRAKQFRYSLDLLQPTLLSRQLNKAYSDLKKLSQRLGEINDHATTIATLSGLLKVDFPKKVRRYLRYWRKDERRALRQSVAGFADWWTSKRRRRMRQRLKKAARADSNVGTAE